MTHTYNITGMTCGNCVAKVKSQLLVLGDVTGAEVQLSAPQATITMQKHIPVGELQKALSKAGNYTITETGGDKHTAAATGSISWWGTYKPILLIGAYITGTTVLIEAMKGGAFNLAAWMASFMAAFFLTFSFFKLLDLKGFAESYSSYDIIAKRWQGWGYAYAFIELLLGLAYLLKFNQLVTNLATFVIMTISIIGVLQTVFNKRKIRCACLGAIFDLPMSTVTIVEDALMISMSLLMLTSLV